MCGRFILSDPKDKIIFSFGLQNSKIIFNPRYNIFPSEKIPVIIQQNGINYLELMQWGLIPFWSKGKKLLINARVETAAKKPSFSNSFRNRRCLVPANGFFEWKQKKLNKQPYFICLKNTNLFAFAGLWDEFISKNGEKIKACTILTTSSNPFMEKIHNRMPVILTLKNFEFWFNYSKDPKVKINSNFPSDEMQAWEVSKKINSTRLDNPNCIKKIDEQIQCLNNNININQGSLFD